MGSPPILSFGGYGHFIGLDQPVDLVMIMGNPLLLARQFSAVPAP